jgi:peptide/nickel transport system permease protein
MSPGKNVSAMPTGPPLSTDRLVDQRSGLVWKVAALFWRNPNGRLGAALLALCLITALGLPYLLPTGPYQMIQGSELKSPSAGHPLGTDEFGRDLLSRVALGIRMSLTVAVLAVLVGGIPGILSGLFTGYYGGVTSSLILRVWDGLLAFPPMLLAIVLATILGPGPKNAAIALGIISVPEFSRIVRSGVLVEHQKDYVTASISFGASSGRILFRHILPNVLSPILVETTLAMGSAVALEAALSFLGLGIQPPDPSLGSMLNLSRKYLFQAWWYPLFPGIALAILLMSLNWVTEALTEAFDPRSANLQ